MADNFQEKIAKELSKQMVDSNPSFTKQMKFDLKTIIDFGRTPEEIINEIGLYLLFTR